MVRVINQDGKYYLEVNGEKLECPSKEVANNLIYVCVEWDVTTKAKAEEYLYEMIGGG